MVGNFLVDIETITIWISHSGYEQSYLLRQNVVSSTESEAELIATSFTQISYVAYF
jgi:hypothetical protein